MQAVYPRSLPYQPHSCRLIPPSCLKSHLIGLVWSHASISIHLLWPWLNLMGVKEVFTLAMHTLIVCLADLVNWKRWKWSQSVRLIGSATHPHSLHCLHSPPPTLSILSRFTLGYFTTFCCRPGLVCLFVYVCVCVLPYIYVHMCMSTVPVWEKKKTEGEKNKWSGRWMRGEWTLVEWGGVKKVWSN